jgi:hypothetical protein
MWKRRLLNSAILVALLLTLSVVFAVLPSEVCEKEKGANEEHCATHSLGVKVIYETAFFLDKWNAVILAFATIAIAGFTLTLRNSTDKLWDAGERQLRQSRESSERQLRAYIAITGCQYKTVGNRWVVVGRFKNVGQTPAFRIRIQGHAFVKSFPLKEIPAWDESRNDLSEIALFPTEDVPYYEIGDFRRTDADMTKPESDRPPAPIGGNALWLIVQIRYFDTFSHEHRTSCCVHSGNAIPAIRDFEHFHAHNIGNEAT